MDTQKKILVIGDDRDLSITVRQAFSPPEFSITYAESVTTGLRYLLDDHPHLILYHSNSNRKERADVFRTLKPSSLWSHIPIIFITDSANKEDFSQEWSSNDDHVIVPSNEPGKIIAAVQSIVQSYQRAGRLPADDFELLFQLSPYGIMVFNEMEIVRVNRSFLNAFNGEYANDRIWSPKDIFEKSSFQKIKNWMNCTSKEKLYPFQEHVKLNDRQGMEIEMQLIISSFRKTGRNIHYIGFLIPVRQGREELADEVCKMLKSENINLTDAHEKKISEIINAGLELNHLKRDSIFTRRENEVLRLSMEGCSIKIIADKLAISSRTVEKYRTKLMEKSGGKNIAEVIVFALKNDMIRL